jgi:hypothetical protein
LSHALKAIDLGGGTWDFPTMIVATFAACSGQAEARQAVIQHQQAMSKASPEWQRLSLVLDRILAGERDETTLGDGLNPTPAMIVETILQGISDPSTPADLMPSEPQTPS